MEGLLGSFSGGLGPAFALQFKSRSLTSFRMTTKGKNKPAGGAMAKMTANEALLVLRVPDPSYLRVGVLTLLCSAACSENPDHRDPTLINRRVGNPQVQAPNKKLRHLHVVRNEERSLVASLARDDNERQLQLQGQMAGPRRRQGQRQDNSNQQHNCNSYGNCDCNRGYSRRLLRRAWFLRNSRAPINPTSIAVQRAVTASTSQRGDWPTLRRTNGRKLNVVICT